MGLVTTMNSVWPLWAFSGNTQILDAFFIFGWFFIWTTNHEKIYFDSPQTEQNETVLLVAGLPTSTPLSFLIHKTFPRPRFLEVSCSQKAAISDEGSETDQFPQDTKRVSTSDLPTGIRTGIPFHQTGIAMLEKKQMREEKNLNFATSDANQNPWCSRLCGVNVFLDCDNDHNSPGPNASREQNLNATSLSTIFKKCDSV